MANSLARAAIDVGSVIADTYKLEGLLGRGGMGAVFAASHLRLPGKQVAIKLLHAELHDEEVLNRFRREAEIASRLGHPNIVTVHDYNVTADGTPYLVLELLHGETLAQRISRGPMSIEQTSSVLRQVGSALAAAHREGIVHRDLKPQNIFLVPTEVDDRSVEIAKVLDFGISKIRGSQTVKTQESSLLGTPQYMAPEQATGQHTLVDERTDVFALGAITYEMVLGRPAFSGASIPEVVFKVVYEQPAPIDDHVPPMIADAIRQAMAKTPEQRFATVSAFVEALTGQPVSTFRSSSAAILESGSRTPSRPRNPDSSPEALANTMGSGDYGAPMAATAAAVSAMTGPPQPIANAATVQSISPPLTPPPRVEMTAPAATTAAPPSPGRMRAVAIGGFLFVAATVVVVYLAFSDHAQRAATDAERGSAALAMTGSGSSTQGTEPTRDADLLERTDSTPDPGTPDPTTPDPKTEPKTPEPTTPDPKTPEPKKPDPRKPDPRKADPLRSAADEEPSGPLADARAALKGGEVETAMRLATTVLHAKATPPRVRALAMEVIGIAACRQRDAGKANATVRQLQRAPAIRRRVIRECHEVGLLEDLR